MTLGGDLPDGLIFLAAPRNAEPIVTDLLLQANLEIGRHIHLLDQDGDWCLDGRCPTSTDVRGISAPGDDELREW